MSKNEILTNLYKNKNLDSLIKRICDISYLRDDLKGELLLHLAELQEEKIMQMDADNKLLNYCSVYIKRQIHSSSSPFFYKYRKLLDINEYKIRYRSQKEEKDLTVFNTLEKIDSFLRTQHWYKSYLFKLYYYQNKSYREIETKHQMGDKKICYNSIRNNVMEVKNDLENHLKDLGYEL